MDNTLSSLISDRLPRLAGLVGARPLQAREDEFQHLGMPALWQVERDLELLTRHLPWSEIARAYRNLLRNAGGFIAAMYEIRVAAMLAPGAGKLALAPRVGSGRCDLKCDIGGKTIFMEVSTKPDKFPFGASDGAITPLRGRVTVEASFDPTTARDDPDIRGIAASQELRERISEEVRQLPSGELTVLVVGVRGGRSGDMELALCGDVSVEAKSELEPQHVRVPNGLFEVPDDLGGVSRLSAVIWMKVVPHFHDVRVYCRLFLNPRASWPLCLEAEEALRAVFDRRATLARELERIKKILLEEYKPDRVILFGSLASDYGSRPGGAERPDAVHEWSDIDLAIVKSTGLRFVDRIREVVDLVQSRVGLNVLVLTPEEFERAEKKGGFFVKNEILKKGWVLFP